MRESIRRRLVAANLGLSTLTGALLFAGVYMAFDATEDRLFDDHFAADVATFIAQYRLDPGVLDLPRSNYIVHVARDGDRARLPEYLRALPPGADDLTLGGRPHDLLVARDGDDMFYFLFDETEVERYEQQLVAALALVVIGVVCAAIALSIWLSWRIVRPLTALTDHVLALRDQQSAPPDLHPGGPRDEVDLLSSAIYAYHRRIQALLQRERDFSGDVAHELRTPLMAVQGAAENLEKMLDQEPRVTLLTERIRRSTTQMATLIAALLYLARDASDLETHLRPVDVQNLVADQVRLLREVTAHRGLSINFERQQASPAVAAIPAVLSVVVGNLLKNAVTHTDRNVIDVVVAPAQVVIRDYGPGIDGTLQATMFGRFVRGGHGDAGGAGIGRALVKRFCEQFGWALSIDSDVRTGTCITLRFDCG